MDSYAFYPCSRYSALLILLARNYLSNKSVSEFNKSICCLCILQNLFFILCLLVLLLVDVYQAIIEIWLMPLQKLYKLYKARQRKSNQINHPTKTISDVTKFEYKTESTKVKNVLKDRVTDWLLAWSTDQKQANQTTDACIHACKQASTTQKQIMCFCLLERLASWESSVT